MDAFSGDLMRASLPVSSGAQRLLARGLGLAPFGLMLDEGVVEVGATMMTSIWGGGHVLHGSKGGRHGMGEGLACVFDSSVAPMVEA
jgi:hypothetical protein